eukprot:scaffold5545_cov111-Isochrysis_galbana.AAC.16
MRSPVAMRQAANGAGWRLAQHWGRKASWERTPPVRIARRHPPGAPSRRTRPEGAPSGARTARAPPCRRALPTGPDTLVVRPLVLKAERGNGPLAQEGEGRRGSGREPDHAGVEDGAVLVPGRVSAHERGDGARALVTVRGDVEAVSGCADSGAALAKRVEQRQRVFDPGDVRVGHQHVPAGAQHLRRGKGCACGMLASRVLCVCVRERERVPVRNTCGEGKGVLV